MRPRMKRKSWLIVLMVFLVLVVVYSGFQVLEPIVFPANRGDEAPVASRIIVRDGVEYYPRQDVTVLLMMGIDQSGPVQSSGSYNNAGAADMLAVAVFDEAKESYTVLTINRDTITNVPVLGPGGHPAGTAKQQLALAHTYGSGLADSAENTRNAVSSLLYNFPIDYYISMRTDAIAVFNDAVGGVTVTVTDDFSKVDETIPLGEVKLKGQQAVRYVQSRSGVGDQLNLSRMKRQEQYMQGFVKSVRSASTGWELKAYDKASDYVVTDCSQKVMSSLLSRYGDYTFDGTVTFEGQNIHGGTFMEFYPDEADMDAKILRLLYAPRKG